MYLQPSLLSYVLPPYDFIEILYKPRGMILHYWQVFYSVVKNKLFYTCNIYHPLNDSVQILVYSRVSMCACAIR